MERELSTDAALRALNGLLLAIWVVSLVGWIYFENRRFEARLAFIDGKPVGFTLFFPDYSTWEGRAGLFLEDIFVAESARRRGVGRALMADLAAIALARGWRRINFRVLTWNPAREFYHALGFAHIDEWLPYRIEGDGLRKLAKG